MTDDRSMVGEEEGGGGGGGFGLLNHLPAILLHRRWFLIVPFVVLSIAGAAAAFLLPTTYRSSATLLVESQELPPDLVGSPVTAMIDQRIAKIRQQVLSRGDLIQLIQQYNLYPEKRREQPLSAVIEEMRTSTNVAAVAGIGQGAPGQTNTIAFQMSFDYTEPAKAQLVMQSFVERFLELDAAQMAEQADNTVQFLNDQASGIQRELAQMESQITALKAENGAILARAGVPAMAGSGSYDAQIAALQRENFMLEQQARAQGNSGDPIVAQAESDLAAARALYTDSHPDVRLAERRLEAARRVSSSQIRPSAGAAIAAAMTANNVQIAELSRLRAVEDARLSSSLAAQSRAPVLMEEISQLESRADSLRQQYREVSARLLSARSSARMESEQKGERLSVVDPPVIPDKPLSPNRPLLIAGGMAAGLGAGLVLAFLVELLLHPIRGVTQIEKMLGVPPLVVIPTMQKGSEVVSRMTRLKERLKRRLMFRRRGTST